MDNNNNSKIHNLLLENKLSNYLKTSQENKEINENLNKLYCILNQKIKNEVNSNPLTIEINYISIGISILIILLIVDIILRIKN